ncbi:thiamine pyrophosphate-binding protein [Brevibacterium atlanticum]|uniref:thiamine pyrophosphate-binding protein n=1 Tax=Brevibacterium atlanticum TaxID=2697563 RepID=UPI00141F6683|nr:thiamine pyrophosphate-binding protein [Brevibacterium atlanticum]
MQSDEILNGAEVVARAVSRLGASHCFGVVGSGNFAVTNALIADGVRFVAARHEGGAVTMADGCARMSGIPTLVSVHQGCGLTNTATGLGEAAKSRTPIIVLTAESARGDVNSNFTIDQDAFAESVGATARRLHRPETVLDDVLDAWRTAVVERRTVVLSMPLDVQSASVLNCADVDEAVDRLREQLDGAATVVPADVEALFDELDRSERPVFIAGRGARRAAGAIAEFAEATGALVATSAVAKGLFNTAGHQAPDFNLGISGGFSSPATADLIMNADLIVSFGCALNDWTTRHGRLLADGARLVQIDVDAAAPGRFRDIDLALVGDAAATARVAVQSWRSSRNGSSRIGYRTVEVKRAIAEGDWRSQPIDPDLVSGPGVDPRAITLRLDEILPDERIVSVDSGNFMGYPSQFLGVPDENGFCFTQAFQSIGLGLATAIGAALAQPGRLPVLGTGDGGFHMAIAELETAVRLSLPLVCIVYNDAAYGAEVHHFGTRGAQVSLETVRFPQTDVAEIARGFGADAITVEALSDLDAVTEWIAGSPTKPLIIDAHISSDGGAWWLQEAFSHH